MPHIVRICVCFSVCPRLNRCFHKCHTKENLYFDPIAIILDVVCFVFNFLILRGKHQIFSHVIFDEELSSWH